MIADRYDCFIVDLDGVVFRGDQVVPQAPEALARLRVNGRRIVFMTNNSSRTPGQVADKLASLGIEAHPDEVQTSALATADLLAARGGGTAFVIGEAGIKEALSAAGLRVLDGRADRVDYVVVGWDREVTFSKLATAALLIQSGAGLVATNADPAYPAPEGLLPGAGALLAVLTTTTGVVPEVVGKPHAPLYRAALRRAGGGRPLVIGDRLDTDILGAAELGWDSFLVLTGITGRDELAGSPVRPTYVADDLSDLFSNT